MPLLIAKSLRTIENQPLNISRVANIAKAEKDYFPHIEIATDAFEVTMDVFEYNGLLKERYAYE